MQTTEGLLFRFIHKGWRKPLTAYRSGEEICASGALLAWYSPGYAAKPSEVWKFRKQIHALR